MNKKEILKSIKIALVLTIVLVGVSVAYADTWIAPGCSAPDCNTALPINISNTTQTKEGDLYFDDIRPDRLHSLSSATFFDEVHIGSAGEPGDPSLSVLGNVTFYNLGSTNVDNEGVVYPVGICVKSDGTLDLCDPVAGIEPDEPFSFDGKFRVRRVTGSGNGTNATCGEDKPYVVGGGGYCINASGVVDPSVRKSVPIKTGGASYYNAWRVECTQGGDDVSAVSYVHCSD